LKKVGDETAQQGRTTQRQQRKRARSGQIGLQIRLGVGGLNGVNEPGIQRAGRERPANAIEDESQQENRQRKSQQKDQAGQGQAAVSQRRDPFAPNCVGQAAGGHLQQHDSQRVPPHQQPNFKQAQASRLAEKDTQGHGQGSGEPE